MFIDNKVWGPSYAREAINGSVTKVDKLLTCVWAHHNKWAMAYDFVWRLSSSGINVMLISLYPSVYSCDCSDHGLQLEMPKVCQVSFLQRSFLHHKWTFAIEYCSKPFNLYFVALMSLRLQVILHSTCLFWLPWMYKRKDCFCTLS